MSSAHPKAFVSHSTQDRQFVQKFAADLRKNGVDAWYSGWEITPGDSIRAKIDEGLEGCEFFIIVLSKSSVQRPWVKAELDGATIRKLDGKVRKIIPVKIEDCGDLPPTLNSLCWEDFSNQPYETALTRILDSIFGIDVRPPLGQPGPTLTSRQLTVPLIPLVWAEKKSRLELGRHFNSVQVQPSSGWSTTLASVKNIEGKFENTCHNVRAELKFVHSHTGDELRTTALFVMTDSHAISAEPKSLISLEMLQSAQFALIVWCDREKMGFFTFTTWPFDPRSEKRLQLGEWDVQISITSDAELDRASARYVMQLNPNLSFGWTPIK